jgi:vancomycin resistance protein VanJ
MNVPTTQRDENPNRLARSRRRSLAVWVPSIASGLLCLALSICYLGRPDASAAITIIPLWAWLVPGLFLAAFNLRGRENRKGWPIVAAWLTFVLLLAEEPWSIGRALTRHASITHEARAAGSNLRVITLNCAIGNRLAAAEVATFAPDIVLLQESPGRSEVEKLARRLFGADAGVAYGVDASLIARGRVVPGELPTDLRGYFVHARVTFPTGPVIEVVSTRLVPAVFRADLWSPDCWREQAENRRRRREQVRAIAQRIGSSALPVIVGGDFNAPQGDAVFQLLRPTFHDSFAEGGVGWGNTIINDLPVLRIDQIWVSDAFHARAVVARRTRYSDHRMVICDLELTE